MRHFLALILCTFLQPVALHANEIEERAFEGAQWVMATQAARAVSQVAARAAAGTGPLAEKIRERQHLENDLSQLRRDMVGLTGAQAGALRQQAGELGQAVDRIDAEIRAEFPEYAELSNPTPLSFGDVQNLLRPGEALIFFLSDRAATYVWAVSAEHTAWHRAPISAASLTDAVRKLRADLDPTGPARAAAALDDEPVDTQDFDLETAHNLYRELIAPIAPTLAGSDQIFVVKDGALTSLPLGVLISDPENKRWLIQDFAFTTLPAVASLKAMRTATIDRALRTGFVGYGDPLFNGPKPGEDGYLVASRSVGAAASVEDRLQAIRQLSPLPGTARELTEIAGLYAGNADIRLGAEATETAVKTADLSDVAILSFATHGLVSGELSGLKEPALAFTPPATASAEDDGLLTASEASALKLNADWVILSACNTAAGDGTPGAEGLSGLARAFLMAGARSMLVSHWPVRDDAASLLMSDTLRRLQADPSLPRAEALRRAMLDVMQTPELSHPSAWAPFVVVGEGGTL